jgi:2-polyprenyl-6-methoxyphenol hydroxylase-like FAD-dependent oxidoreductase
VSPCRSFLTSAISPTLTSHGGAQGKHREDCSGYTSWRGIVYRKGLVDQGVASESWGAGARFDIVAMPGGRTYWYAIANAPEAGRQDALGELADLRERFCEWHEPIPTLLDATLAGDLQRTDIHDRPRPPRTTAGRVALLGDAAPSHDTGSRPRRLPSHRGCGGARPLPRC